MTQAALDLLDFIRSAVRGICNKPDEVQIEAIEVPPKTIEVHIEAAFEDLKYVYAKLSIIQQLAICIAKKHQINVKLVVLDH